MQSNREKLTEVISLRLTETQARMLQELSKEDFKGVTDYIRAMIQNNYYNEKREKGGK